MVINKSGKVLLTISSAMIGFLLVTLVNAHAATPSTGTETSYQSLAQVEQENQQLAADNQKIQEELNKFKSNQNASEVANEQLEKARISAGLAAMSGPGIRITLDDSKKTPSTDDNINMYLIHEQYLREIVNTLWNGGAEAIAVNGQRITSATAIFCNGSNISINDSPEYPPYVIEAIGVPSNLQGALDYVWTWDLLGSRQEQYGITRELEVPDRVNISAGKAETYQYAEPVKEGS